MDNEKIEVCLFIVSETDNAFKVTIDEEFKHEECQWIPKSQVKTDQDCGKGDTVIFAMPEWLAIAKDFV